MSLLSGFRAAVAGLLRDVRRGWSARSWTWVGVFGLALAVPLVVRDPIHLAALGAGAYVALAAVGLNLAVGLAGIPSLGQGAFVGIGAFTAAWLRSKAGWDPLTAVAAGALLAAAAGVVAGAGVVRLRAVFVAVSTWVVSWLMLFALAAFPRLSGGAQGIPLPEGVVVFEGAGRLVRFTPGVHWVLALVLLALALAGYAAAARGPAGLALAALRQGRSAAAAIGVREARLRLGAFVAAAAIGGLAGGLWVQLAGVADPTAYGPLLSVKLLIAVLLGGAGTLLGPVVGATALVAIPVAAGGLGGIVGVDAQRFEPAVVAALLLVALVLGRGGLVRLVADRFRRSPPRPGTRGEPPPAPPRGEPADAPLLEAGGIAKRFGGLSALDGVSLAVRPAEIHALIGPNGSGKTTLLRVLSGTLAPDAGRVRVQGEDRTQAPAHERLAAGIVRTLQRTEVFVELTCLEHVMAGAGTRRRSGAVASLLGTPRARADGRRLRRTAEKALDLAGLPGFGEVPARHLAAGEQRLLMIATALATDPLVLLVDEPSAGMSLEEARTLRAVLHGLSARGLGLLVVEHNLALVGRIADRVTVLDAGGVIATGPPRHVADDPAVRAAYLGPTAGLG